MKEMDISNATDLKIYEEMLRIGYDNTQTMWSLLNKIDDNLTHSDET